ncbi:hypothetical protein PCANC_25784 [Puccinia coronata f. sp. avenae]|uniref:Uncharacterized protein n=1 Tax=Puccinia coronata f. sp. avenae TaxID=200324 RepID=A0A2N5U4G8_9BASI|nr:hypothetical protein PCANC_25784 [Puccinia coronata f. sp. avenae]
MAMAVGIPDKGDQEVTEVPDQDLFMFAQQPDAISPKLGHVEGAHELFPHAKGNHKPIPPMGGTHKQPPLAGGQGKIPVDTNNEHAIPQEACGQGWHPPPPRARARGFRNPEHGVGPAPIGPHPLLEIYLGRCHITVDDNNTREILTQHCIRHSSFFLRSTKEELIRIGLTLGAAQSLNQNPVELMRRAADQNARDEARDTRRQN